jgi:hypothetical protein
VSLLVALLWLFVGSAHAHSWMIREGYATCAECHLDPSGAGLLTGLRPRAGRDPHAHAVRGSGARLGAGEGEGLPLGRRRAPDWLELGGSSRSAYLLQKSGDVNTHRFIQMQGRPARAPRGRALPRLRIDCTRGGRRARRAHHVHAGHEHRLPRALDRLRLNDHMLVRPAAMPLPFGLRVREHTRCSRGRRRRSHQRPAAGSAPRGPTTERRSARRSWASPATSP